ncbi:MAG: HDOD domain-containing protein [Planctomycetes bacterium]|nr:HDOD domain-containing protein [Planctomycetota bacterium]
MDVKVRKVQLIVDQVDNLPTLPMVATRVLALATSDHASVRDLADIIESDPSLTSRILALVNSASFGGVRASVSTVNRACSLLGFEAIRNSVLSLKVFDLFSRKGHNAYRTSFDRRAFWKHSLAVAAASQLIARTVRGVNPEEAFVAGLLHDIGKVALDFVLPKTFDQVVRRVKAHCTSFADAENRILGLDHTVIGKRLTENWDFPAKLINVVWLHHQEAAHLPNDLEGRELVRVVGLADLLAREQRIGMGSPMFAAEATTALADQLSISASHLETIGKKLHGAVAEHVRIMGLENSDEQTLFYESVQNANAELGLVNERLMMATRQMHRQKRHTDLLIRISRSLSDARSMRHLLGDLCRAMAEWVQTDVCAVYVLGDGRGFIEGTLKSQYGAHPEHFVFENDAGGTSPMRQAVPSQDHYGLARAERSEVWLFERFGTGMGEGPFFTLPIFAHDERQGAFVFSWPDPKNLPREHDCREMEVLAHAAGLNISLLYQREQTVRMLESLADASRQASEAREELLHKRNLASVGAMAAGAAHEINNPLAVISGRAQILAETEEDEQKRRALDIIADQAQRASDIISDLMSFARPPSAKRQPTDLATIVRKVVETQAEHLADKDIAVEAEGCQEPVVANIDGEQLRWAIEELVTNASYACQAGGRITVAIEQDRGNDRLCLSVTDTGSGMDHETLSKAYDPFFSGRSAGRGRGLGLAKVQRIAEAHGASVRLDSAVGQGTTARLLFDLSTAVPVEMSPATTSDTF